MTFVYPWGHELTTYPANSATYIAVICKFCNGNHTPEQCPRVAEIEYYRSGAIRRVKLHPPAELRGTISVNWTSTSEDAEAA